MRLLIVAALGFGAAEIAAGLMPSYVAFAAMCPVIGFCTLTLLNSANATMQLESDPAYRGRVMALYMTIVMGGTPLGSPVIGWVGETFGPRWTLDPGRRPGHRRGGSREQPAAAQQRPAATEGVADDRCRGAGRATS